MPGRAIQRSVGVGLAVLTLFGLNACATVDYPAAVYSSKWTNSTECFDRYQINLPQDHRGGTGWMIAYGGWQLKAYPRNWDGKDTRMKALEAIQGIRNRGKSGNDLYVTDRVIKAGRSFMYVTKEPYAEQITPAYQNKMPNKFNEKYVNELKEDLEKNGLEYEIQFIHFTEKMTYWIDGGPFRIKYIDGKPQPNAKIVDTEIDRRQKRFEEIFVNRMRELAPGETPTGPGVCMNGSFIADDGKVPFEAKSKFKLNDYPNTYFSIDTGGALGPSDKPLLERKVQETDSGFLDLLVNFKYGTIRQGKRDINGVKGSEKLVKWDGNRYLFRWESDDGALIAEMESGVKNKGGSTLSQQEAMQIWDSILPTLKRRGEW